jgi:hypothetical protein
MKSGIEVLIEAGYINATVSINTIIIIHITRFNAEAVRILAEYIWNCFKILRLNSNYFRKYN